MVHQTLKSQDRTKLLYKSGNIVNAKLHVLCRQHKYLLATNNPCLLGQKACQQVLDLDNAKNTSKNLPIVALCWFLFLLACYILDILYLPNLLLRLVEILLFQLVDIFLLLEVLLEADLLELARCHMFGSVLMGLFLPNNVVLRISNL